MQRTPILRILLVVAVLGVGIGGFSIAYGSGGRTHVKTPLLSEDCGTYVRGAEFNGFQTNPNNYAYLLPSPLAFRAGNSVDLHWVQDRDADFMVWDMGRKVKKVHVFPSIDHGPIPGEALEFTVYASSDPNPPDAVPKWAVGNITRIYDNGWNLEWIADDFVSQWRFDAPYRYVAVHWGGPRAALADGDAEIDAVCIPSNGKG